MKAWLLKLHRWAALVFALPLVLLVTGRFLSFEPWLVARAMESHTETPGRIEALLIDAGWLVIASIAMIGLLMTGLWIWLQHRVRRQPLSATGHAV